MYKLLICFVLLIMVIPVQADTMVNIGNNTVSTGKITIDGVEVGGRYGIQGSGKIKTLSVDAPPFHAVNSRGSFDLEIQQGPTNVDIVGDDNLVEQVNAVVVEGELRLDMKNQAYSTRNPLVVRISSPKIDSVKVDGTSDVQLKEVITKTLTLNFLGSVDVEAEGQVEKLDLHVKGTGDVAARRLRANSATVVLSGSGDITLTALDELVVKLTGTGDVTYYGQPDNIQKSIVGVGDIESGE